MAEAVSTHHPEYDMRADEWQLMRDAAWGETKVKEAGERYLPMPSGFRAQTDGGAAYYAAYQKRAQFAEIVAPAVQAMVGIIHQAEIQIDMPDAMQAIWERATKDGLSLEAFHRRVTAEILLTGRYSILADAGAAGGEPYLAGFQAEALINWDDDRSMFVLDESGLVRNGFQWNEEKRYLALELIDGRYIGARYDESGNLIGEELQPVTAGRQALNEIPFVVIGPRDLSLTPETPPLIGVARSAIAMYQLSADYRWQLFMTGQETLFVINGDAPDSVGAGVVVSLKGGTDSKPPDAKYVGPQGTGIAAHRQAITDEKENAATAGARLFNSGGGTGQESGEARRIRYTAETASLVSIAQASCGGLEKALRYCGRLMGLPDNQIEEIVVTLPKDLVDRQLTAQDMTAIMGLWEKGLISGETAYENLQAGRIASPERTWEEERELIDEEDIAQSGGTDEQDSLVPPVNDPPAPDDQIPPQ